MPTFQKKVSVAANAVNDNVMAGSQWEFMPYHAQLNFGMNQSATGLVVDAYSGSDTVCEALEPAINARYPIVPDDYSMSDVVGAGERVKVRVRNTTGGALDFYLGVIIQPLG